MDLVSILQNHAQNKPHQNLYTFLDPQTPTTVTYQEFDKLANRIASNLSLEGIKKGDRILIALPQCLEYLAAFWACLYAQIIAVPVYPPVKSNHAKRTELVLADSGAEFIITDSATIEMLKSYQEQSQSNQIKYLNIQDLLAIEAPLFNLPEPNPAGIAFLQYTSGSTGTPKGVVVKHQNLINNLHMMQIGFEMDEQTRLISWLPFFHDMGLIGNGLMSAYLGAQLYFMSPAKFIKEPLFWLKAISDYQGSHVFAPNFAFEMCATEINKKQQTGLNLSSLRFVINGAEPVRYKTIQEFSEAFKNYGFKPDAWSPGYGMAEATLYITRGGNKEAGVNVEAIDEEFFKEGKAITVNSAAAGKAIRHIVSHGKFTFNQDISIVNPQTLKKLAPREIGEIWVKGPHVCDGYWQKPDVNQEIFGAFTHCTQEGPWLRTGDLGYINEEGELFIVGRHKDLIVIRGKNYAPHDIEQTVEACDSIINTNNVIAFSIDDNAEEKLVIVVGLRQEYCTLDKINELHRLIKKRVLSGHGLIAADIVFINHGGITKTTSGKLQRQLCKKLYLANQLPVITFEINH